MSSAGKVPCLPRIFPLAWAICLICCCVSQTIFHDTTLHMVSRYNDMKPTERAVREVDARSKMECASACFTNINYTCTRISFNKNTKLCSVYNTSTQYMTYYQSEGARNYDTGSTDYERDCYDIMMQGNKKDGVYKILMPGSQKPMSVYCDMTSQDPGWIVIQRRTDGSEDFDRDWSDYNQGFGNLSNEFWLGNWKLNRLTKTGRFKLRIELEDFENETAYAVYDNFKVKYKKLNFKLIVKGYTGTAGDSFSIHNNMKFTTKDRDNDDDAENNCADAMHGGWWFRDCQECNLNGQYGSTVGEAGITWNDWRGQYYSLKKSLMKIRRLENDT